MKIEEVLARLESLTPAVVLVPVVTTKRRPRFPVSATALLVRYRRCCAWLLDEGVMEMVVGDSRSLDLRPWGWFEVVEARIATAEEIGGEFPGRRATALAIARADERVKPIPIQREWLLGHEILPGKPPLLVTCAFWLRSRQHAYLAILEQIELQKQQESNSTREVIPVTIVRSLDPPPDTRLQ